MLDIIASGELGAVQRIGTDGVMTRSNPLAPQYGHHLRVRSKSGKRKERVDRQPSGAASRVIGRRAPRRAVPDRRGRLHRQHARDRRCL